MRNTILILIFLWTIFVAVTARTARTSSSAGLSRSKKAKRQGAVPRTPIKKSKVKRSAYDDEEDEDEEEDDEEDDYKPRNTRSRRSAFGSRSSKTRSAPQAKKMALVPWSNAPKSTGTSWRERLEGIAKTGQSAYKDVYRRAKVLRSSAFEGMLLRATWPGDDPIPQDLLDEIIKYSIPAFKYGRTSQEDDPYHMTVHKLWTKMCERDWRTVVKSLFILHSISRESSEEVCERFAVTIKDMSRERNPKKPHQRYFDTRQVSDIDETGTAYTQFLLNYATLVFYRTRIFSGRFEEINSLSESSSQKAAVAKLKKAQQYITMSLKCLVTDKSMKNPLIGKLTQIIANDLRDLWKLFGAKLAPLADIGMSYGAPKASSKDIVTLLNFYEVTEPEVNVFLKKSSKICNQFRYKLSTNMETVSGLQKEDLQQCILKLSGGYIDMVTMDINQRESVYMMCRGGSRYDDYDYDEEYGDGYDDYDEEEEEREEETEEEREE
mmetsp:Transcript_21590/g.21731  ORF Transcript_21590/g.21731 Transcript_21590/m.21731 type:complete len:493 (-) Transcript_21590:143-1621(-)